MLVIPDVNVSFVSENETEAGSVELFGAQLPLEQTCKLMVSDENMKNLQRDTFTQIESLQIKNLHKTRKDKDIEEHV